MTIPPEHPRWNTMLSFQYSGMDLAQVNANVLAVRMSLGLPNDQFFCSFDYSDWFKSQGMNVEAIYQWCLKQQEACQRVIFLIDEGPESMGMKRELELAQKRNQDIIMCIKHNVSNEPWVKKFIQGQAKIIVWQDMGELAHLDDYKYFAPRRCAS